MRDLRVISGRAKGRRLKRVPGDTTRPIRDLVKQALFNIIGPDIEGAAFLDLFAGTGSVGIEALSRGASRVVFVERHPRAIRTIRENLARTGLEEGAEVIQEDVFRFLERPPEPFDYIYIAPPQYQGLWAETLRRLDARPAWLGEDGWAIAQIHPKELEDLGLRVLREFDRRRYGKTMLVFYERPGA